LGFGSAEGYLEIPKMIAYKRGLGATLAEGVKTASEKIGKGSRKFAMETKGLEFPGYDPRGSIGMALAYATSDRGACHAKAWPVDSEAFGDLDPFTTEGKAALVVDGQHYNAVKFSFIFCDFYPLEYPSMARFYNLATGLKLDEEEIPLIGERIYNLTRLFNVREGFTREHDTIPPRLHEPLKSGVAEGRKVSKKDFEFMLGEYYELRGWNEEGVPKEEKLKELGLHEIK
jgi:aldehyde:ferredoxin oxidoreductase